MKSKKEIFLVFIFYVLIFLFSSYSVGFKSELMIAFGVICLISFLIYYLLMKLVPDNFILRVAVVFGTLYIFRFLTRHIF